MIRWGEAEGGAPAFWHITLAVILGGVELLWPAMINGYPILFSDTHAFLVQGGEPQMVWDKPFVYGPLLRVLHGGVTLWLPAVAQALVVSHLLWLVRQAFATPSLLRHVVTCLLLAVLTTAPWFTSLLMPDVFAAVVVLCLFLLAFGDRLERVARVWAGILGTLAIAVHLSHLVIAAACILAVALLRTVRLRVVLLPLLAAIALLVATNIVGYGRFAVSPFGSVFMLARLVADGPAAETLARQCPQVRWRLCAWVGRLPTDSDAFLWNGDGPVWTYPGGPTALAREAAAIVAATVEAAPVAVARAAFGNAMRQMTMYELGDTLAPTWLEGSVTGSLTAYFPPREIERFRASMQARDALRGVAQPLAEVEEVAMLAGGVVLALAVVTMLIYGRSLRGVFAALILVGVLSNAAATGALSKPHHRYQARIVWLLVAAPLLAGMSVRRV